MNYNTIYWRARTLFRIGIIIGALPCNCNTHIKVKYTYTGFTIAGDTAFGGPTRTLLAALSDLTVVATVYHVSIRLCYRRLEFWSAVQTRPASFRRNSALAIPIVWHDGVIQICPFYAHSVVPLSALPITWLKVLHSPAAPNTCNINVRSKIWLTCSVLAVHTIIYR